MLRCADPDKKPFDLTLTQADNYGCMSPDDWERLLSTVAKAAPVRMKEPVAEAYAQLDNNPWIRKRWNLAEKRRRILRDEAPLTP